MSGLAATEADRMARMRSLREGLGAQTVSEDIGGFDIPERQTSSRAAILDEARKAVTVDRAATHGELEDTFGLIAGLWSARLGVVITPAQVCILLIDLKTARAWGNPAHADNWVDIAGYAACGGEVAGVAGVAYDKA